MSTVNMPLCNLKSEELECWLFFPTVKDPHTQNTKYYVPSGQIPRRDELHAYLFRFGQIVTNNSNC